MTRLIMTLIVLTVMLNLNKSKYKQLFLNLYDTNSKALWRFLWNIFNPNKLDSVGPS